MRFRLLLVTAVLTAFSLVVAAPASAATITQTDVRRSLLTVRDLGDGWRATDLDSGSGTGSDIQGCEQSEFASRGVRHEASRDFQYQQAAEFISEDVTSYRTKRAARRDFNKGVRSLASCTEFTMDGKTFRINALSVNSYADQIAAFRIQGSVATESGDVPVTLFLIPTRWGRQVTATRTIIGGTLTSADLRGLKNASVRIAKVATSKVATRLGR